MRLKAKGRVTKSPSFLLGLPVLPRICPGHRHGDPWARRWQGWGRCWDWGPCRGTGLGAGGVWEAWCLQQGWLQPAWHSGVGRVFSALIPLAKPLRARAPVPRASRSVHWEGLEAAVLAVSSSSPPLGLIKPTCILYLHFQASVKTLPAPNKTVQKSLTQPHMLGSQQQTPPSALPAAACSQPSASLSSSAVHPEPGEHPAPPPTAGPLCTAALQLMWGRLEG